MIPYMLTVLDGIQNALIIGSICAGIGVVVSLCYAAEQSDGTRYLDWSMRFAAVFVAMQVALVFVPSKYALEEAQRVQRQLSGECAK